jgi:hypothetical protein
MAASVSLATGLIDRSKWPVSSAMRPSSKKRVNSARRFKEYPIASANLVPFITDESRLNTTRNVLES